MKLQILGILPTTMVFVGWFSWTLARSNGIFTGYLPMKQLNPWKKPKLHDLEDRRCVWSAYSWVLMAECMRNTMGNLDARLWRWQDFSQFHWRDLYSLLTCTYKILTLHEFVHMHYQTDTLPYRQSCVRENTCWYCPCIRSYKVSISFIASSHLENV